MWASTLSQKAEELKALVSFVVDSSWRAHSLIITDKRLVLTKNVIHLPKVEPMARMVISAASRVSRSLSHLKYILAPFMPVLALLYGAGMAINSQQTSITVPTCVPIGYESYLCTSNGATYVTYAPYYTSYPNPSSVTSALFNIYINIAFYVLAALAVAVGFWLFLSYRPAVSKFNEVSLEVFNSLSLSDVVVTDPKALASIKLQSPSKFPVVERISLSDKTYYTELRIKYAGARAALRLKVLGVRPQDLLSLLKETGWGGKVTV